MAPTTPLSAPSAGGSKSATAVCAATRFPRMRCGSVVFWPGVATYSPARTEPIWQGCCSKSERPGSLTAFPCLTSEYQVSNDHKCYLKYTAAKRLTVGKKHYGERQLAPSGTSATFLLKTFPHIPYVSMGRKETGCAT